MNVPRIIREIRADNVRAIQLSYFELVERFFRPAFTAMQKNCADPEDIAYAYSNEEHLRKKTATALSKFTDDLTEFWTTNGPITESYLQQQSVLKAVFGGEIFISHESNVVRSTGLYFDTTVLCDPLLRLNAYFRSNLDNQIVVFEFVKAALTLLKDYKELATADVPCPIVMIIPDAFAMRREAYDEIEVGAAEDTLEHCSFVFGKRFRSINELRYFLSVIESTEQLDNLVKEPSRFVADVDSVQVPSKQLELQVHETRGLSEYVPNLNLAERVETLFFSRFMATNRDFLCSERIGGTPAMERATSWQYLIWKYGYLQSRTGVTTSDLSELLFSKVLQAGDAKELILLRDVPNAALIQLRKENALGELREVLRKGVDTIRSASVTDFRSTVDALSEHIGQQFARHQEVLLQHQATRNKFLGFEIIKWLGLATVQIAGAWTGNPTIGTIACASTIVAGSKSVGDIYAQGRQLMAQELNLRRSATGILYKHLK